MSGPAEVTVTGEGITHQRTGVRTEIAWQALESVKETPEAFLLFQSRKRLAGVVLKRGFSPEQQQELGAFVAGLPARQGGPDGR